ncbi:espin [Neodiprion pinetum]|uniref:Espin n=1 Tax=Neodiprion lecontei TaxID=441921 RepID=A0A6J0CFH2_NEOLC|nr:espin [Neodiprion lecontei]XP_046481235.1 espin [Neodiprion pinetum]
MAQHQLIGSDFSEDLSDGTTCSCATSSIDKCSLRGCEMFQEPFYLHPPSARPRDGIYINPMTAFIADAPPKPKDTESFYLHSPNDLVYTRITPLFGDSGTREGVERKDETLTVKVDIHANNVINNNIINNNNNVHNNNYKPITNGVPIRSNVIKDTEHAYEQICLRQAETDSVTSSHKKISDNVSDSSNSRKTDRRYSRSSSVSESSNMSSELQGFSSPISTPSLSRNSSSERIDKPKLSENGLERKTSVQSTISETEKEPKIVTNGSSFVKPPPPPPPPPLDPEEIIIVNSKVLEVVDKEDRPEETETGQESKNDSGTTSTTIKNGVSSKEAEVDAPASSQAEIVEEIKPQQVNHLISKHMVLPFIPPKFINAADSNTLLKPSEYLKSICKSSGKNTLSKARSVDNLDIQSRQEEEPSEPAPEPHLLQPGPPPPPLPPLQKNPETQSQAAPETETVRPHQPLATISIQDLTSVQLRRTNTKIHATKTFSAPPPRSVSMTNVSEPFFVQKIDLIAELKMSKDISGIKKLKVERAQVEKSQEQNLMSEITKTCNASKFVDQIPEKDSAGNVIPIWKRQMLARKAAERAKKELEEQIARENEEKRLKAIPAWKRQLLAKKDHAEEKKLNHVTPIAPVVAPKVEVTAPPETTLNGAKLKEAGVKEVKAKEEKEKEEKVDVELRRNSTNEVDDGPIIPWRAQLRKTNSKLNILE